MDNSIDVSGLSKVYRIGALQRETMLREKLVAFAARLYRRDSRRVESIWALQNVSFGVREGEVVGIIGRNGAGKSTLLKVLSRITYPTTGSVSVRGRIASLLEVGTGFHEELTGRENVFLNGSILGMRHREVQRRFDEIVEFAGVEKFIDTPIKRYSSGMRLRLGFAVAAHLDPDVLIVDEVLAVGDAGFQKKCLAAMSQLRSGGRTVLFVSHNMAAVENLCSRGIWIDQGTIRLDGDARDVIRAYMSTFSGAQQVVADLRGIADRHGSGEVRFTSAEFLGTDGQPQLLTRSGDPLTIRLRYHASVPVPHPSVGFRLFTEMGTLVTESSTWHNGIDIPGIAVGDGYLDIEIASVNLLPARYPLSLWITGIGNVVHDGVENSAVLEVEVADVYRSGRVIDSRYGLVFFPQRWSWNGRPLSGGPGQDSPG
jgi:lipopolysaccharide transport system ATP-binding protein